MAMVNLLDTNEISRVLEYCTLDQYVEYRKVFKPTKFEQYGMPKRFKAIVRERLNTYVSRETPEFYRSIGFPLGCTEKPAILKKGDIKALCQQLFRFLRRKFTFK